MVNTRSKSSKKRKVPVTAASASASNGRLALNSSVSSAPVKVASGSSSKPESSQAVIQKFHVLLKRRTQLEKRRARLNRSRSRAASGSKAQDHDTPLDSIDSIETELKEVERKIKEMGGLATYQRMSLIGQGNDRGGGSEKVLIGWLEEMGMHSDLKGKGKEKLRVLEVGALKPDNYDSCLSWMDVHSIDLRSQHPRILEMDFLEIDLDGCWPGEASPKGGVLNREGWDVVSLSLVVNFAPDLKDRGRMLIHAHNLLLPEGLLFFVLPLPCVTNSRYMTIEHLTQLMNAIGFEKIRERWKEGGKMAYWLFQKRASSEIQVSEPTTRSSGSQPRFDKKVKYREGKRNNFCILL